MPLEDVISKGSDRLFGSTKNNWVVCSDDFKFSVIAGGGAYCLPQVTLCWGSFSKPCGNCSDTDLEDGIYVGYEPCGYQGPYTHLEVGFPSARPEPWSEWEKYCAEPASPTTTVYSYVPIELVRQLAESHGGERNTSVQGNVLEEGPGNPSPDHPQGDHSS